MTGYDVALKTNPGKASDVELATALTVATGELFPIRLDGTQRLADVLRARRLQRRLDDEALLLLLT